VLSVKRQDYCYSSIEKLNSKQAELALTTTDLKASQTLELHGSGTTNPSKYFWKVMGLLQSRLQSPAKMSYRAVGSSTGKQEFIANVNGFGSGDIPMFQKDEDQLAGTAMLQFPFCIGT